MIRTVDKLKFWNSWPEAPVVLPRLTLVIVYLLCVYDGILSILAGVPIFDVTQPVGYSAIWGALLAVSALLSAIFATTPRWERLERWSCLAVWSLLLAYVGALNFVAFVSADLDRYVVGGVAVGFFLIPFSRFLHLASKAGGSKK